MENDYLKKQWNSIEHTTKVISVKNLSKELSLVSSKNSNELEDIINRFFMGQKEAFFVNDNQVIDEKTLSDKNIPDVERLKQILYNEYFIINIDESLLLSYLNKRDTKIADDAATYEDKQTKKEQIFFPDNLFNLFYLSYIRWIRIINSDTKKARLIWQYLNYIDVPSTVYDIYFNLCGALFVLSINEINTILHSYENFVQLYDDYWMARTSKNSIDREIQISNILSKHIHDQQIHCLLEIYVKRSFKKQKLISMDDTIRDLRFAGMDVIKDSIEEVFIGLQLAELIPGYWMKKGDNISVIRFNLTDLWNDMYQNVISNIIKNPRDIEIFTGRILGDETLEQVGARIGVTRERVRQIEKKMRRKMVHTKNRRIIKPFYEWLKNKLIVEKIIDLRKVDIKEQELEIFDVIIQRYFNDDDIYRILDNIVIYKPEYERLLDEINSLSTYKKIINLNEIPLYGGLTGKIELYDRIFTEIINMVKLDEKEYFYSGRKPTNEEEIFIIIYKSKRPLHFTEVPEQAKKFNLSLNIEEGRNVLATMQRGNLLKRVAPGTYAPKEWDIPKLIYITDLVYKILKDADRPMCYEEIYSGVRKNRIDKIKRTSVQYYLDYHEEIMRIYTKQYILKEWTEEPEKLIRYGIEPDRIKNQSHDRKVILDVFRENGSYITKYKLSEASFRATTLRISRYVELNLESHIVVIDRYNNFHFHSCGYETISGINRWKHISVNDIFYIEFINERIARLLTAEEFVEYTSISSVLLAEAEDFWSEQMDEWNKKEEDDEEVIEKIKTVDDLISFGLEKGYVYVETIEKLVDKGYDPRNILYELQDRDIVVNY